MYSIAHALAETRALGLDRLDAQLLLLHAWGTEPTQLGARRAWLLAHVEDELPAAVLEQFRRQTRRRADGEPLAYITGHREFFGLDFNVDPRVLVPRPDTETLVSWALELLAGPIRQDFDPPFAVLDLGTGSGAIALALKHERPDLRMDAIDVSPDALAVARANAQRLGLQVQFGLGSWLDQVTRQYHCIVANPPYVAAHDPHLVALVHEPQAALVSGPDGLQDIRHIVGAARTRLCPGGWLLIEHGFDQAALVRELFITAGYRAVRTRRDLGGNERCTGGHIPASIQPLHRSQTTYGL